MTTIGDLVDDSFRLTSIPRLFFLSGFTKEVAVVVIFKDVVGLSVVGFVSGTTEVAEEVDSADVEAGVGVIDVEGVSCKKM